MHAPILIRCGWTCTYSFWMSCSVQKWIQKCCLSPFSTSPFICIYICVCGVIISVDKWKRSSTRLPMRSQGSSNQARRLSFETNQTDWGKCRRYWPIKLTLSPVSQTWVVLNKPSRRWKVIPSTELHCVRWSGTVETENIETYRLISYLVQLIL